MKEFWKHNSLSIVMFSLFGVFLIGQFFTGFAVNNQELEDHGRQTLNVAEYVTSGHFMEAVFENWESEFLQMGAYVVLTVFLFQKGSSESKPLGKYEAVDAKGRRKGRKNFLYRNSLAIALFSLFLISFLLHGIGGSRTACAEATQHNQPCDSLIEYMTGSQFWFESFQNWQSEFLSVFALVMLTIFLRQQGSPESKPVDAPHDKTGSD